MTSRLSVWFAVLTGILFLVWSFAMSGPPPAHVQMSFTMVAAIGLKLEEYHMLGGCYPSQDQGLQALITQPETEPLPTRYASLYDELPRDPWGRSFKYLYPGRSNPERPEVISAGPDGLFDTEDDISNQD